ncbi:MAG: hypothetical protein PVH11_02910 [Anaerolineae bacterium]|jgi:hypothetical protein
METLSEGFASAAGAPAALGLLLTALIIFLTSDWRLALTALLVQYILAGLTLTRFIMTEIAILKILIGVLAVFILYLTARYVQETRGDRPEEQSESRLRGLRVSWSGGPLGLPVRVLVALLIALGLILGVTNSELVLVSFDITVMAFWLAAMGVVGLVVSSDPMRVAPAVLTILTGFDLIYSNLEPSLAVVGFFGALILLAALAFSYLAIVQATNQPADEPIEEQGQT